MKLIFEIKINKESPITEQYNLIGDILLEKGEEFKTGCVLLSIHDKSGEKLGTIKIKE